MDAYAELAELLGTHTKTWFVRPDLRVVAYATERGVELGIAKEKMNPKFDEMMPDWRVTQRNLSTLRELASVILAACDFVEEHNPEWAANSQDDPFPPERFEGEWEPFRNVRSMTRAAKQGE